MKSSSACALLIAGLGCASAALADEAWRTKPAAEWNEIEIRQILERSPWARRVSVILVRPDGEAKPCLGSKGPCENAETFHSSDPMHPDPGPIKTSSGRVSAAGQAELRQEYPGAAEADDSEKSYGVAGIAVVRWASARTVRDALSRMVPPSGKRLETEELAQLSPADAYVMYVDLRVALADASRVRQSGLLSEATVRRSSLLLRPSGRRISAVRVAPAPLPEFDSRKELALAAYYIFFPKQRSGHATLPVGETDVRFECPLAPVPIHADFKLSRMERGGSPDF